MRISSFTLLYVFTGVPVCESSTSGSSKLSTQCPNPILLVGVRQAQGETAITRDDAKKIYLRTGGAHHSLRRSVVERHGLACPIRRRLQFLAAPRLKLVRWTLPPNIIWTCLFMVLSDGPTTLAREQISRSVAAFTGAPSLSL